VRTGKSLEVSSVNDISSGISPNTIPQESQHVRQDNSRAAKVERLANIAQSLNSGLNTCTPISQGVQGIFADGSGGEVQQAAG
jgi:hypothetical protein